MCLSTLSYTLLTRVVLVDDIPLLEGVGGRMSAWRTLPHAGRKSTILLDRTSLERGWPSGPYLLCRGGIWRAQFFRKDDPPTLVSLLGLGKLSGHALRIRDIFSMGDAI